MVHKPQSGVVSEKLQPSKDYRLTVNGKEVFVYYTEVASYAIFTAEEDADIEIEALFNFREVKVRPLSRNVTPEISGNIVQFRISAPAKLSVEFDNGLLNPLFLFAYLPETDKPDPSDSKVRFYKSGGVYDEGLIVLNEGETLYIEEGAVVFGAVFARDADNISVRGRGILNAGNWRGTGDGKHKRIMQFVNCRNVRIEDVTIAEGPTWNVVPVACTGVSIKNVNVISILMTGDGFDVVGSSDVTISGCFARTNDDCVAIKAVSYDYEEGNNNVRNVLVENCVFWNAKCGNALEIGFETRCEEISDIKFRNCDIIHCELEGYQSGGTFTIHNGDRAVVRNVVYEDIRVEDSREKLFDFKVLVAKYSRDKERGQIQDIYVRNVEVVDGKFPPSIIRGFEGEHLIKNVTFDNLKVYGKKITDACDAKMVIELSENIRFV
jgi:hypothetical protein